MKSFRNRNQIDTPRRPATGMAVNIDGTVSYGMIAAGEVRCDESIYNIGHADRYAHALANAVVTSKDIHDEAEAVINHENTLAEIRDEEVLAMAS